jgi:hypothetical protein
MQQAEGIPREAFQLSRIRSTPFPNALLDRCVSLPETQLKVVLAVVRRTLGWRAGSSGERRASVSMSYRQIMRLTGLKSRSAVGRAVAALIDDGILTASSDYGTPLDTPELRRRHPSALRLGVEPEWVETRQKCG